MLNLSLQTVDIHTEQYWIHLKLEKILAYCHCPDTHLQGLQSVSTWCFNTWCPRNKNFNACLTPLQTPDVICLKVINHCNRFVKLLSYNIVMSSTSASGQQEESATFQTINPQWFNRGFVFGRIFILKHFQGYHGLFVTVQKQFVLGFLPQGLSFGTVCTSQTNSKFQYFVIYCFFVSIETFCRSNSCSSNKIGALQNFAKFKEKASVSDSKAMCFPMNFAKYLQVTFSLEHIQASA